MNPYYKQSVMGIGVAAPLVLVVALLALASHYRGKLEKTYEQRKVTYGSFRKNEEARVALERKVREQDPHMKRWLGLLEEPSSSTANELIGAAQKRYGGKEFVLTSFRRTSTAGGIGAVSGQPSVQLALAFRGTFGALQSTFLELETKMPQLQLDSMKLSPQHTGNVLEAQLLYTAWEKQ